MRMHIQGRNRGGIRCMSDEGNPFSVAGFCSFEHGWLHLGRHQHEVVAAGAMYWGYAI